MKTIKYKGKGEHSVNELELIIEQQVEELHLFKSGQKQLPIHDVVGRSEQLKAFDEVFQIAWELVQEESDYSRLLKIKKSL